MPGLRVLKKIKNIYKILYAQYQKIKENNNNKKSFKKNRWLKKAKSIFTHLTEAEKLKLHELALSKKNAVIVEIGSYLGASSVFLASAARERNSSVYCIDTWENQAMTEGMRDTFTEFNGNIAPLKDYINILRGYSTDVAITFDKKIDIIFFDADHNYEGIKGDWEAWKDKLNKDAILIFHDSGWAEGVKKVIEEDVKSITYNHGSLPNMWWGWLKKYK